MAIGGVVWVVDCDLGIVLEQGTCIRKPGRVPSETPTRQVQLWIFRLRKLDEDPVQNETLENQGLPIPTYLERSINVPVKSTELQQCIGGLGGLSPGAVHGAM
jgi:hypothetical protein